MITYIEVLSEYFPDVVANTTGADDDYDSIVWEGGVQISQADLDAACLAEYKKNKIIEFGDLAKANIIAGFVSSALGAPNVYDAEAEDQLNLIGAVTSMGDLVYSCRALTRGYQEIVVGAGDNTGLNNDSTMYGMEIVIDGTSEYFSILGQDAQTFSILTAAIVDDLTTTTVTLDGGIIKIESGSYGELSSINIIDSGLIVGLSASTNTSVIGTDGFDNPKQFIFHTHAQLLQVLNDGKDVKLDILQKFNVKKFQILAAVNHTDVDAIIWN